MWGRTKKLHLRLISSVFAFSVACGTGLHAGAAGLDDEIITDKKTGVGAPLGSTISPTVSKLFQALDSGNGLSGLGFAPLQNGGKVHGIQLAQAGGGGAVSGPPIGCDGRIYIVTNTASTGGPAKTLFRVNLSGGSMELDPIGDNSHGYDFNAAGINPLDGYGYAIEARTTNLLSIDGNGNVVNLGPISGLSEGGLATSSNFYAAGAFDSDGNYYISRGNNILYKVDINTRTATSIRLSGSMNAADFVYNPVDNHVYFMGFQFNPVRARRFAKASLDTGVVTFLGPAHPTNFSFASMFSDSDGNIYGLSHDGDGLFQIDATTGAATFLYPFDATGGGGDGLNCLGAKVEITPITDYSDGPIAYGTAAHEVIENIFLGQGVTYESESYDDPDAAADEDDGVSIPTLISGEPAQITIVASGDNGKLQGWVDWDGDGSFSGAGEQIALDVTDGGPGDSDGVVNGQITLSINVPDDAVLTQTISRFRWSTTAGLGPTGLATDGEVEDYGITVEPAMPQIDVVKTASYSANDVPANGSNDNLAVGTVITYSFVVTNNGNVSVDNVALSDNHLGYGTSPIADADSAVLTDNAPVGDSNNTTTGNSVWDRLGPGDILKVTATYVVTQEDIDLLQ